MPSRLSVCLSVRPSVRPSVCPSVRPSVCQQFGIHFFVDLYLRSELTKQVHIWYRYCLGLPWYQVYFCVEVELKGQRSFEVKWVIKHMKIALFRNISRTVWANNFKLNIPYAVAFVRLSVRPSVCPSVCPSVRPSVNNLVSTFSLIYIFISINTS